MVCVVALCQDLLALSCTGEQLLKNTGLGYTVIRSGPLFEEPGGYKALIFDQVCSFSRCPSYCFFIQCIIVSRLQSGAKSEIEFILHLKCAPCMACLATGLLHVHTDFVVCCRCCRPQSVTGVL